MASPRPGTLVLWAQVSGLAAVQGAISLCWVIYNLYLLQLLTDLGFPSGWAMGILIIENGLAIAMEPLMGTFSDRLQHQVGTRFPLVSLGVILSAGLFMAIPTALWWGQAPLLRWVVPLLLIAWSAAMTVFRSPALSLLGRYAFRTQLPQAASLLTLVGGLAGSMGPLANQAILNLGPGVAFGAGSGVLLLAALALRWAGPNAAIAPPPTVNSKPWPWLGLGLVFGAGVGVTLGFRLVMTTFPKVITQQLPNANGAAILGLIFITLALSALPAGSLATRLGNLRSMVVGLAIMAAVAVMMGMVRSTMAGTLLAVLFGASFSLVANGTIPFALGMVPPDKAGLGTGTYFSGGALALCVWGALWGQGNLAPGASMRLAALAFLLAGLCVGQAGRTHWRKQPSPPV